MFNLNGKQIISIVGVVISVLMVSTSQLTDLFGAGTAKTIVSISGLANMILQGVMTVITSQGSTIRDVAAMQGVEKITVNSQANSTLATLAVDPLQNKVAPTQAAEVAVTQIAKGA